MEATDYHSQARVAMPNSQPQMAIDALDKAIGIRPEDFYLRGSTYLELGQHQRAIQDYDKALQLDPSFAAAYNNRWIAHNKLGEYTRADPDQAKACSLDIKYCLIIQHFPPTPRPTYTPIPRTTGDGVRELVLSTNSGPPGEIIIVVGTGFQWRTVATIWLDEDSDGVLDSNEPTLGNATVGSDGTFAYFFTVTVPPFIYGSAGNQIRPIDGRANIDNGHTATFTLR